MSKKDEAIERIKRLECPTGDLASRVAGILEDYGVARQGTVWLQRDSELDDAGVKGFVAHIPEESGDEIVIMAKSGADDYVAKVMDAYPN